MGKRGPKSKFTDVACPNKIVKITVLPDMETLSATANIEQETQPFEDISGIVAGKHSVIVQILFITTFAKTNLHWFSTKYFYERNEQ